MPAEQQPSEFSNRERQLVQAEHIPQEIQFYPQWVCWRYGEQTGDGKPPKQPINPWNLHCAGVHWPTTWSTFAHAYYVFMQQAGQTMGNLFEWRALVWRTQADNATEMRNPRLFLHLCIVGRAAHH
jgi:hypothetical protein